MNKLSTSIISGILSSTFFATSNALDKKGVKLVNPLLFSLIKGIFNVLLLFVYLLFLNKFSGYVFKLIVDYKFYTFLAIILFGSAYLSFLYLIKNNYVVKVQVLITLVINIIHILAGIYFFKDVLNLFSITGIILILLGLIFLEKFQIKELKNLGIKSYLLILLTSLGFAYYPFYLTFISKKSDVAVGVFLGELLSLISIIIFLILFKLLKSKQFNINLNLKEIKKGWKISFLSSLTIVLAFITTIYGTTYGYYSITLILTNFSLIILSLIGHFYLNEKLEKIQFLGVIIATLGLIIISLNR
jgi:drug/metabolite transporter (DMT)-like permease